jgi:hypothetical protein
MHKLFMGFKAYPAGSMGLSKMLIRSLDSHAGKPKISDQSCLGRLFTVAWNTATLSRLRFPRN